MSSPKNIRIGISGWTYPDWRGVFYPEKHPIKRELEYASRIFNSIEVNGTFYALQKPHTFAKWYEETPSGFSFALKAPKYVTHERRLRDVETPVANFFASGVLALKEKLGPILWQLPPSLPYDRERLEIFLKLLPRTTMEASNCGSGHSEWMKDRAHLATDMERPILHTVEVRHESFNNPEFFSLMRDHQVSIVIGDTAGRWPLIEEITSSLVYIRLHGDETVYPHGYTKPALKNWAKKITAYPESIAAVYAFCDNDHKVAAPKNAKELKEILGISWEPAEKLSPLKTATHDGAVSKPRRKSGAKNKSLDKRRKIA